MARDHRIRLAVSNPCFELWLILHFEDQTAFIGTSDAERMSRRIDGRSGKRIEPAQYLKHRRTAAQRATWLATRHERDHTYFPQDNPSSGMGDLLTAIEP